MSPSHTSTTHLRYSYHHYCIRETCYTPVQAEPASLLNPPPPGIWGKTLFLHPCPVSLPSFCPKQVAFPEPRVRCSCLCKSVVLVFRRLSFHIIPYLSIVIRYAVLIIEPRSLGVWYTQPRSPPMIAHPPPMCLNSRLTRQFSPQKTGKSSCREQVTA